MPSSEKRRAAREKYRPKELRVLLVAEAPPADCARYFYFPDVATNDWLFMGVMDAIFCSSFSGFSRRRSDEEKTRWLREFQQAGFWLLDAMEEPISGTRKARREQLARSNLRERIKALRRQGFLRDDTPIILIKATVYDDYFQQIKNAGFNVIDKRIPFPAYGHQPKFRKLFKEALGLCRRKDQH